MKIFDEGFKATIEALREKRPLVHCITNYVTAGDTANMLLAAGASPIMADDPAETAEICAAEHGNAFRTAHFRHAQSGKSGKRERHSHSA